MLATLALALWLGQTPSPPPDATTTKRGLVNTTTQSFGGTKTFIDGIRTNAVVLLDGGFTLPTMSTAALTLFVDPTGNDANACTGTGTSACLTLNGAVAKLPNFLRHSSTIDLAAGSYTVPSTILIDQLYMSNGVTLTIRGSTTWNAFTPASGTATGTLSAYATNTFPTRPTATDSTQSWPTNVHPITVDNLTMRGRFLCITSGGAINIKVPIAYSTPTALELVRNISPSPSGATYQLCTPSTILTHTSVGSSSLLRIGSGGGSILLQDMNLIIAGAGTGRALILSDTGTNTRVGGFTVSTTRVRVENDVGSNPVPVTVSGDYRLTFTDSVVISKTALESGNNNTAITIGAVSPTVSQLGTSGVYIRSQRTAVTAVGASLAILNTTMDAENITNNTVLNLAQDARASSLSGLTISCYSYQFASSSTMVGLGMVAGTRVPISSLKVDGCFNGIDLLSGVGVGNPAGGGQLNTAFTSSTLAFTNINSGGSTGAAIQMAPGSTINLQGATVTFTSVTNGSRYYVCPDLTTSYSEADVQAAPSKIVSCQTANLLR